jgi:hypothetical protein
MARRASLGVGRCTARQPAATAADVEAVTSQLDDWLSNNNNNNNNNNETTENIDNDNQHNNAVGCGASYARLLQRPFSPLVAAMLRAAGANDELAVQTFVADALAALLGTQLMPTALVLLVARCYLSISTTTIDNDHSTPKRKRKRSTSRSSHLVFEQVLNIANDNNNPIIAFAKAAVHLCYVGSNIDQQT